MTTGKALLGVMAGLTAGAILGILFAPERGATTRRRILRKGEDMVDDINDRIEERLDELMDNLKYTVKRMQKNDFTKSSADIIS